MKEFLLATEEDSCVSVGFILNISSVVRITHPPPPADIHVFPGASTISKKDRLIICQTRKLFIDKKPLISISTDNAFGGHKSKNEKLK